MHFFCGKSNTVLLYVISLYQQQQQKHLKMDLNFSAKQFENIVSIMQANYDYIDHQKVAYKLISIGLDEDQADWVITRVAWENDDITDMEAFLTNQIDYAYIND